MSLVDEYSRSLKAASGNNFLIAKNPRTGAEDFSYFSQQVPGIYFRLGVNKPGVEKQADNHSPFFTVDDNALDEGLKVYDLSCARLCRGSLNYKPNLPGSVTLSKD